MKNFELNQPVWVRTPSGVYVKGIVDHVGRWFYTIRCCKDRKWHERRWVTESVLSPRRLFPSGESVTTTHDDTDTWYVIGGVDADDSW